MFRDLARFVKWCLSVIATVIAVVAVAALVFGQVGKDWRFPWDPPAAATTTATTTPGTALAGLVVADERCDGYDRDAFGRFTDETYAHVVARAQRTDQWTGQPLGPGDDPEVDHVVPVHEAFCSGLPETSWAAFYNDPDNLLLTAGRINRGKSDREPGEWAAPSPDAQCRFVATWVAIKAKWQLTVDPDETNRLAYVIGACQ